MMPDLFREYLREPRYSERLTDLLADRRKKLVDTDLLAVKCLLEERKRLHEFLRTVARYRDTLSQLKSAQVRGVSREQGLEQLEHTAAQLAMTIDAFIRESEE